MEKQIIVNGTIIDYFLKRNKRAKRIIVYIKKGGLVFVTIPYFVKEGTEEEFLKRKYKWIIKTKGKYKREEFTKDGIHLDDTVINYRKEALNLVNMRIKYFNSFYNFKFKNIRIKNQESRWGSCSTLGNLNFNWKIVLLPQSLSDYIIVHELCHLKEMNHQDKFWNLVSLTIPEYKKLKRDLISRKLL
ncbi:MAG: M48 family metallopeptidase [Patescibacteria group bacterium]